MFTCAIDTGNKQIKTEEFTFLSGVTERSSKPDLAAPEDILRMDGKYYVISNTREDYMRDKTTNSRYFTLAMMGLAKELDRAVKEGRLADPKGTEIPVTLLTGLPPAHMEDAALKKRFRNYFKAGPVKFQYLNRTYSVDIRKVSVYTQCYAAIMTAYQSLKGQKKILGIDIGGFTADYMAIDQWKIDLEQTDSLEAGVIRLYRKVQKDVGKKADMTLSESDIDAILRGEQTLFGSDVEEIVRESARKHVESFLGMFREVGIDLKSYFVVFMGGGAVLLRPFLEQSPLLKHVMFIEDIHANAKGYMLLHNLASVAKRNQ